MAYKNTFNFAYENLFIQKKYYIRKLQNALSLSIINMKYCIKSIKNHIE